MTDREQLCKEFTELTGGHWHEELYPEDHFHIMQCSCGATAYRNFVNWNQTYDNPVDVLKVMENMSCYTIFIEYLMKSIYHPYQPIQSVISFTQWYIIKPDAILKAAVKFLKEKKR
jgi:hypothetical protein